MNISSRKQLLAEAGDVLKQIREEVEGIDKKVETAVKKMTKCCEEDKDLVSGLVELAKLVGDKKYQKVLEAIKDIEKAEEGRHYFIDQYIAEIQKILLSTAKEQFSSQEFGVIYSAIG
jgi:methyl-accepting chemotaxis protein